MKHYVKQYTFFCALITKHLAKMEKPSQPATKKEHVSVSDFYEHIDPSWKLTDKPPTKLQNFLYDGMDSLNEWFEKWWWDVEDSSTYGAYSLGSLLTGQWEQAEDYVFKFDEALVGATFGVGPFGILKYASRAVKAENACDECINSMLVVLKKAESKLKKATRKSVNKVCNSLGEIAMKKCKLPGKLKLACPFISGAVTFACKDILGGGKAASMIRKMTTGEGSYLTDYVYRPIAERVCSINLGPIESKCKDITPLNTACCNEHFPGCCRAYISEDGKTCGERGDFSPDKLSVIIKAGQIYRQKDFSGALQEIPYKDKGKLPSGVTVCRPSYKGIRIHVEIGAKCVEWSKTPYAGMGKLEIGFHNFCRNPDGDKQGIWCYVKEGSDRMKKEYCDPPIMNKSENGKTCKETCSNPDGDPKGMWCTEEESGEKAYCKESTTMLTQDQKKMKRCCPKEFPNCCESYIHDGTCSMDNKSKTGAIDCTDIQNVKFPTQTQRGLTCKDWDSIDLSFDCPVGWEKFYEGKDDEDDESSEFLYCRRKSSPSEVCALGDMLGGVWGTKDAWVTLKGGDPVPLCRYPVYSPKKFNPHSVRGRGLGANFCRNPGDVLWKTIHDTNSSQWGGIPDRKSYTENPDGGESKGMWCYTGDDTWDYCGPKFFFKTSGMPSREDVGPSNAEECKERAGKNTFTRKTAGKKFR